MSSCEPVAKPKRKSRIVPLGGSLAACDNAHLRVLGGWEAVPASRQTPDFSVPVARQFQKSKLPRGESFAHAGGAAAPDFAFELTDALAALCRAAEAHRQVRRYIQPLIRPGVSLNWLAAEIEAKALQLVGSARGERGLAFPAGVSVNSCAAHYTPNPRDAEVLLGAGDVLKVDFGVHVNGFLVDSAFTVAFDPRFDNLLLATKEATEKAIKLAGPDALLSDIGGVVSEVISSYEVELDGKVCPVVPIGNLSGHMIRQWQIHAEQSVPLVRTGEQTRMLADTLYAIETFASTGAGRVSHAGDVSHYMIDFDFAQCGQPPCTARGLAPAVAARARRLYAELHESFRTLAWAPRHLEREGIELDAAALRALVQEGVVCEYPPLVDLPGSYTSQFEHTIFVHDHHTTVLTRGSDY